MGITRTDRKLVMIDRETADSSVEDLQYVCVTDKYDVEDLLLSKGAMEMDIVVEDLAVAELDPS